MAKKTEKQRGARYATQAVMAGQRLQTRKMELEEALGHAITLRELQAQTGVDFGGISEILNGEQANVSVGNFFAICEGLKIDPLKAWYGESRKPSLYRSEPPTAPEPENRSRSEPPPASMPRPVTGAPKGPKDKKSKAAKPRRRAQ